MYLSVTRCLVLALAVIVIGVGLLGPGPARASLLGTDATGELTGSRDVTGGGGLEGFNDYDNGLFTVEWEITLGPTVHYKYTFTGLGGKDISNIVLDVSPGCETDPFCVTNASINGNVADTEIDFGNFAGIGGGVKIEGVDGMEGVMYEFDSNRLPVYGHLGVKDGGGPETCDAPGGSNIVCSNQLLGLESDEDPVNFVAVPNGVVPEPGTGLLLGLGVAARAGLRRRR